MPESPTRTRVRHHGRGGEAGLLSEPIAAECELAGLFVIRRERPHALANVEPVPPIVLHDASKDLRIGVRPEVAETSGELAVVVQFAVVGPPPRSLQERLRSPVAKVDDFEARVKKHDLAPVGSLECPNAVAIRPAMAERHERSRNPLRRRWYGPDVSGDAAHVS